MMTKRTDTQMWRAWPMGSRVAGLVCALMFVSAAHAAQLSVGAPRIGANGWEMPVVLAPGAGENVSSMQFDVVLPSGGAGASAQVSDAAALAGKQVMYSTVAPGQVRVVIAGLNQSPLAGGQVATLYLGPVTAGQAAPSAMLSSPVLASPNGDRVPVEANTESADDEEGEANGRTEDGEEPDTYTPPKSVDSGDAGDDVTSDSQQDEAGDSSDGSTGARSRSLNGYPPFGNGMGPMDEAQRKAAKKNLRKSPPSSGRKGAASGMKAAPLGGASGQEYRDATERARNAARNPVAASAQKYTPTDQRNRKKAIAPSSIDSTIPETNGPAAESRMQLADAGLNREDWGKAAGHDGVAAKPSHAPGAAMPIGTASLTANGAAGGTAVVLCAVAAFVFLLAAVYLPLPWLHRLLRFNRSSNPADE